MTTLTHLYEMSQRQHGVFTRAQAYELGITRHAIRHRLDTGEWIRLSRQVVALAGSDDSTSRRLMAATLDAGNDGAIALHAAAAMFGAQGYELNPIHVIQDRCRVDRHAELAIVHSSTFISEHHIALVDEIRVTTPTRLAFDLSGRVHEKKLERTVEAFWSRGLTTWRLLKNEYEETPKQGRPRVSWLRAYLDGRGPNYRPADSGLELRVRDILAKDGQRGFRQQVLVGNDEEILGRSDFADEVLPLILFIDSELFHGSLIDRARDKAQTDALEAAGYVVLRVRAFDVWHNPRRVCTDVREARAVARQKAAARAA